MKNKLVITLSILIAVTLIYMSNPSHIYSINNNTIRTYADYPFYNDGDSLINTADVIIKGEVLDTYVEVYNINNTETRETEPINQVYTIADIKISEVFKGDYAPGDIIKVKQLGGEYKDKKYVEESTKQFEKSAKGILFLKTFKPGIPASLLNPVQGFIELKNEKVKLHEDNLLFKEIVDEERLSELLKEKTKK